MIDFCDVHGAVRSSVAATVEHAALGLAGGGLDRAHAAEGGEGSFVAEAAGGSPAVISRAAAVLGPTPFRHAGDLLLQVVDLGGQLEDAAGQQGEAIGGGGRGIPGCADVELGVAAAPASSAGARHADLVACSSPPGSWDTTHLAWQFAGEEAYSSLASRPQTPAVRVGTSEALWSQLPVLASSTNS